MHISVEWFEGKYPSFNLQLSSKEGVDPFLIVRGCRIVQGSKGDFVSYPAKKLDSGKYWNHCYGSDKFNEAVLKAANESKPVSHQAPSKSAQKHDYDDIDSDIPF